MMRFLASAPAVLKPSPGLSPSDLADLVSFAALMVVFIAFAIRCLSHGDKANRFLTLRSGLAVLAFGICSCDAYIVLANLNSENAMEKAHLASDRLTGGLVIMGFMLLLHTCLWATHRITKQRAALRS